ncbi:concanavalin A-like lectin/glucanase domain-containing protein [Aspergillus caelatus]|uniref:chitinase n=2 Tax=Aspergillus subgen. Circumdati TaxID=2720871 RepID=A0A5N7AI11_9EURO|nr:concanavalin A-like lectin/glucanase domain-containing protein [Aspergillus caelatus]KAE8369521.1 concanavalin A-like lectin/glucanase domain-containing protein [Aspergillus caelatus]KAE8417113.1 concanavalin A-like lectin/glucanase domain-containing protein [Aspergillus pseudocaelatus]
MSLFNVLALLVAFVCSVTAQTWTDCNPLNTTCPPAPALGTNHSWVFNETMDDKIWSVTNGQIDWKDSGAEFSIKKKLDSPTLQSTFFIFFGIVESHVKMAKGGGIVSSVVLQSADLDEIDWEWVGYNTSEVQSNYFGKGNDTSFSRGGFHYVENADTEFHNYTTYWTQEKLEWWIDGNLVRTLKPEDALDGKNYPQTPSNIRFGIWPAGDPKNAQGTIEWAGGEVDYDAGPYTMVVKNVRVHDFHTGKEYNYTDHSGSWESIKVVEGNSTTVDELNKEPEKSLAEKWADLPTAAHIGVYCGAAAAGVLLIAGAAIYFIRQRKKGRLEYALDDAKWNTERNDMNNLQTTWKASEWGNKGYQPVN